MQSHLSIPAAFLILSALTLATRNPYWLLPFPILLGASRFPRTLVVIYDGDCGVCGAFRRGWERIDGRRRFRFVPYQQEEACELSGVDLGRLGQRIHLVMDERVSSGYRALKGMVYCHRGALLAIWLAALGASFSGIGRMAAAVALWMFFFPPLEPAGEAIYDFVARNRQRMSKACVR